MAQEAGAKATGTAASAMGDNASTIMGIGKEAFVTDTPNMTKTLYEAEISGTWRLLQWW